MALGRLCGAAVGFCLVIVSGCSTATGSAIAAPPTSNSSTAQAYVCNYAYDSQPGTTITPVDLNGPRPEHRLTIGSLPSAVASSPDGRQVLVTAQGQNTLVILDTSSNAVTGRVSTGLEPDAVAITPDGKTAVVANFGDGTVTPVDLSTALAGRPVPVGPGPTGVAISPVSPTEGTVAWVAVGTSLVPLSLAHMTTGAPLALPQIAEAIALSNAGRTAWVAGQDGTITPVNLSTGRAGPGTHLEGRPSAIAVAPPSS
jgi:YVTN family beta-propeller protein